MKKIIALVVAAISLITLLSAAMADETIIGDWYSKYNDMQVKFTFNEDGTGVMELAGEEAGTPSWVMEDGQYYIKAEDGSKQKVEFDEGHLIIIDESETSVLYKEPIGGIVIAEVNPDAKAVDFEGTWDNVYMGVMKNVIVDNTSNGESVQGMIIKDNIANFTGTGMKETVGQESITFEYANGSLIYSKDLDYYRQTLKAELLMDGILRLTVYVEPYSFDMYYAKRVTD